jgi:pyruvate-formate lyase-activating enzyme
MEPTIQDHLYTLKKNVQILEDNLERARYDTNIWSELTTLCIPKLNAIESDIYVLNEWFRRKYD